MFAYGCAIGTRDNFERWALPGLELAGARPEAILTVSGAESIFAAYNELIERALALEVDELEGLVLIHDDVENRDPELEERLREAVAEPDVGIVGAIGGREVSDMSWGKCKEQLGYTRWRIPEESIPRGWTTAPRVRELGPRVEGDADAIDGLLIVLSQRALKQLRFDEALGPSFHGYDADICAQARAAGLRVVVRTFELTHHHNGSATEADREGWIRTHQAFMRKWEPAEELGAAGWERRARLAEAKLSALDRDYHVARRAARVATDVARDLVARHSDA